MATIRDKLGHWPSALSLFLWLKMDCRVVVQTGHLIVTIGSRCGACCRLTPHRPPGPRHRPMVNIQDLIDDARCYETVRAIRWPDGVSCPHCSSASVTKDGRDDTQPH